MSKDVKQQESIGLNIETYKIAKEYEKETNEFVKRLSSHKLPKELDDISSPLTLKEKRAFKDIDFNRFGENDEEMEDFIVKLLQLRKVDESVVDDIEYSSLLIFAQKVVANTFNIKAIAGKN